MSTPLRVVRYLLLLLVYPRTPESAAQSHNRTAVGEAPELDEEVL